MRSEIELMYMRLYSVPCVQLMVQGGPGTLQTVHQAPDLAPISP